MARRRPSCSRESLRRGAWTDEEDRVLKNYIKVHGEGKWKNIPIKTGLKRCGKSCRLRWLNYLRPDIKRGNISYEEEQLIIRLHSSFGNKWSLIAGKLPGRTDNEIKNYWNTHLKKKADQLLNAQNSLDQSFIIPMDPPMTTKSAKIEEYEEKNDKRIGIPKDAKNEEENHTFPSTMEYPFLPFEDTNWWNPSGFDDPASFDQCRASDAELSPVYSSISGKEYSVSNEVIFKDIDLDQLSPDLEFESWVRF